MVKIAPGAYPVAQFGNSDTLRVGQRILLMGLSPNVPDAAQGDYGNITALDTDLKLNKPPCGERV